MPCPVLVKLVTTSCASGKDAGQASRSGKERRRATGFLAAPTLPSQRTHSPAELGAQPDLSLCLSPWGMVSEPLSVLSTPWWVLWAP